jgi:putative serine protease PepD
MTDAPKNPQDESPNETQPTVPVPAETAAEVPAPARARTRAKAPAASTPEVVPAAAQVAAAEVAPVAPAAPPPPPETVPAAAQTAPQNPIPPAFAQPAVAAVPAEKKRSNVAPIAIGALVGAIIGGGTGAGVAAWAVTSANTEQSSATAPQTITVNDADGVNVVTAVAAKAAPSVVTISVSAGGSGGTGSGVILSEDGYVLTNTHVVTLDGASADGSIQVTTYDGRLYSATIVGTDPIDDLAVIKLDDASGLQPIEFGDSTDLNVGDRAIAIGAPLGLSNTVTDGIVSALNRSIQIASSAVPEDEGQQDDGDGGDEGDGNQGDGPFDFWNFDIPGQEAPTSASSVISLPVIQTDAAINPGNSGGALVDSEGKLIGINVAIASTGGGQGSAQSGSIGVGFAIPAELAQRVANEIIENGEATHGLLGATVQDASAEDSSTVGALIMEVTPGGAADEAGLKAGDVVTLFNDIPITSSTDLTAQVRALPAGAKTGLSYLRGDSAHDVDVTLGSLGS